MRLSLWITLLLASCVGKCVTAFSPSVRASGPKKGLSKLNAVDNKAKRELSALVAASTILTGVGSCLVANPLAAYGAEGSKVELSTGSIIVRTSGLPSSQNLLKAEVDSKSLITTLFKNRQALKSSVARMADVVQDEITNRPVWKELAKELLAIEGDVLPEVTVRAPADLKQTFTDLTNGKLNLLVNNEVLNLSVEPTFTQDEDEIVFRIKGFKGVDPNAPTLVLAPPAPTPQQSALGTALQNVRQFLDAPFLDEDSPVTNGQVTLGTSVLFIVASYVVSYQYYLDEIQRAEDEAEEKRKAIAAKNKKKKDAEDQKKKKAAEEEENKKRLAAEAEAQKKKAAEEEAKKKAEEEEQKKKLAAKKEAKKSETEKETTDEATKLETQSTDTDEQEVKTRKHRFRFWKNK